MSELQLLVDGVVVKSFPLGRAADALFGALGRQPFRSFRSGLCSAFRALIDELLGPIFEPEPFDKRRLRDSVEHAKASAHHVTDDLLVVHERMLGPSGM